MKLNNYLISISFFIAFLLIVAGGIIFYEGMSNNSLVTISTGTTPSYLSAASKKENDLNKLSSPHHSTTNSSLNVSTKAAASTDNIATPIVTLSNPKYKTITELNTTTSPSSNIQSTNSVSSSSTKTSTPISKSNGTGNFSDLINGDKYLIGTIEGDTIVIPLKSGVVNNNQLILPEYYVDKLDETFTLKIDSLGNNNFTMYEYYNGINTGIFKLKCSPSSYNTTLSGTFSKPGSNVVIGINFSSSNNGGILSYPFFNGLVNGTPVTFAQTADSSGFFEKYSGDSNIFNLKYNYDQSLIKNYKILLTESFNNKITGQYELNSYDNGEILKGLYVPASNPKLKYPVTFTGSFNP
ncbi:hypothetical protein [uncultured Clostridium sp.]|uniref:hypothetical protein n=1 Tax=uncultured Clostridium sp. TaxID=59620 RepID=UPI002634451B|nr:hypothetical protein [uncultured Clostridium sp.]